MSGCITQCTYTHNVTCKYIGNSSFSFTTDKGSDDTTTMHVSTILCDNFTALNTNISIDIGKVGCGNNGLFAGAIVGIVCATGQQLYGG